ncbi:DUF4091 domain-containing protein [Pseudalkalibacillus sp. JSM 102089]|uniref:DUF4091 domain-containing protein n=1 Tax=Pseudalkalibacillus sp. JSM 102089 TaxID=3229856 RepID=UPI00352391B0
MKVEIHSQLNVTARVVGLVPSEYPCHFDYDDHTLRHTPGLYPDPLFPIVEEEGLTAFPNQWRSIWITVDIEQDARPGDHQIDITLICTNDDHVKETFQLNVIDANLPEQGVIHTEWLHTDCIASIYQLEIFSEKYWDTVEKYVKSAADHHINMILTPLFTPPLDTEIGGERPTVQLIDVTKEGEKYTFHFEKLLRWFKMCQNNGIRYFEFSHLFSQWGAKHPPKIIGNVNGKKQKLFGWETDATSQDYRLFLAQFLPALIQLLEESDLTDYCYFHISDEPRMEHLESYTNASRVMNDYLGDLPVIDALSDYAFYEKGLIKNPVSANDHISPFLENNVPGLWTYYCTSQYKEVSNRFFNMPSSRNRILGMQLYKFNLQGFLHWGFNFWYSSFSKKIIDPFRNTDANYSFPSGDAFLVYPGENGPIGSLRLEVLREAFQDHSALQLLESYIGREQTLDLLENDLKKPLTFNRYPKEAAWLLAKRDEINERIKLETNVHTNK